METTLKIQQLCIFFYMNKIARCKINSGGKKTLQNILSYLKLKTNTCLKNKHVPWKKERIVKQALVEFLSFEQKLIHLPSVYWPNDSFVRIMLLKTWKSGTKGYFRKVYRSLQVRVPNNILMYLSIQKLPKKRFHQSIFIYRIHKKIIFCFNF